LGLGCSGKYLERRGGLRKNTEELDSLYSSPDIIITVESGRMRWVGHVTCIGEVTDAYRILVRKTAGKRLLECCRCKWMIIFKTEFKEMEYDNGLDLSGLLERTMAGTCEHGNEFLCSIKGSGKSLFKEQLVTSQDIYLFYFYLCSITS
jgi:hypothetical protein